MKIDLGGPLGFINRPMCLKISADVEGAEQNAAHAQARERGVEDLDQHHWKLLQNVSFLQR